MHQPGLYSSIFLVPGRLAFDENVHIFVVFCHIIFHFGDEFDIPVEDMNFWLWVVGSSARIAFLNFKVVGSNIMKTFIAKRSKAMRVFCVWTVHGWVHGWVHLTARWTVYNTRAIANNVLHTSRTMTSLSQIRKNHADWDKTLRKKWSLVFWPLAKSFIWCER